MILKRGAGPEGVMRATLSVPATNEGTRAAIRHIAGLVDRTRVSADDADRLEIVLAEALNNIVEHAFADREDGIIEITIDAAPPGLHFTITDDGLPMPTGRLPGGNTADPDREAYEQAEGGYGLHLIREVARKLRYERTYTHNRLTFRIPLGER